MTTSSPSSWLKERIVAAEEDLTASHNRHEVTGYPLASRVEFGTIDEPSEQRLGVGCSALFDLAQSSDTDDIVGPGSAWSNLPDHERREIIRQPYARVEDVAEDLDDLWLEVDTLGERLEELTDSVSWLLLIEDSAPVPDWSTD